MKKLLKCVSIFILMFAVAVGVKASPIDDVIEAKKASLKYAKPSNEEEVYSMMDYFSEVYEGYNLQNCNTEGTKCDLYHSGDQEKTETIDIEFIYDESVKKVADALLKKFGTEPKTFYMNDIESINYFYANKAYIDAHPEVTQDPYFDGFALTLPSFSSELKKYLEYNNFDVRVGMGEDSPYFSSQGGGIQFWYNDTLYGVGPLVHVVMPYVVYIPEDATDIEQAIKDRLGKYFDIKSVTANSKTVAEIMEEADAEFENMWNQLSDGEKEHYDSKQSYIDFLKQENILSEHAPAHFLTLAMNQRYDVTFADEWETTLVVIKDNEKANDTRKVITNDAGTGVEISTDSLIPIDALIKVARITSGDEYDKIIGIIKNTNVEMFDLKLFSTSEDKFITKLEDGKFKVKLPIKEEFKGKNLKVYYVDADNKVEEYKVTISDDGNYAIFETDHFSIYTLAEDGVANPKTGDTILTFIAMFVISTLFLLKVKKYN